MPDRTAATDWTLLDAPEDLLDGGTRHLFLTGKGGVGKTSHACGLAVALADVGRKVLLVSTDPASNLAQVLSEEDLRRVEEQLSGACTTEIATFDAFTGLLATLPENTPIEEARVLQEDLRRAGIEPWGWLINRSLAAASPSDPLLVHRAAEELHLIRRVQDELATRVALVPQLASAPTS